jgi:cytochrome c-type biogenesis protein CcmH
VTPVACLRSACVAALLAGAAACVVTPPAAAQSAPMASGVAPEQAEQWLRSERFRDLAAQLRCLVCQNQTLADSNADLAIDLRNEVLRQMVSGKDDAQIKAHLVERYGEFVLYRPMLSARTLALWGGPAVLLAIGAVVVWRLARRPSAAAPSSPAELESRLARVDRLLDPDDRGPR